MQTGALPPVPSSSIRTVTVAVAKSYTHIATKISNEAKKHLGTFYSHDALSSSLWGLLPVDPKYQRLGANRHDMRGFKAAYADLAKNADKNHTQDVLSRWVRVYAAASQVMLDPYCFDDYDCLIAWRAKALEIEKAVIASKRFLGAEYKARHQPKITAEIKDEICTMRKKGDRVKNIAGTLSARLKIRITNSDVSRAAKGLGAKAPVNKPTQDMS